jgi:hypothetical protein
MRIITIKSSAKAIKGSKTKGLGGEHEQNKYKEERKKTESYPTKKILLQAVLFSLSEMGVPMESRCHLYNLMRLFVRWNIYILSQTENMF